MALGPVGWRDGRCRCVQLQGGRAGRGGGRRGRGGDGAMGISILGGIHDPDARTTPIAYSYTIGPRTPPVHSNPHKAYATQVTGHCAAVLRISAALAPPHRWCRLSKLVTSAQPPPPPSASLPCGVPCGVQARPGPHSDVVPLAPGVPQAEAGAPCWWAWVGVALASAVLAAGRAGAMPPAMLLRWCTWC